MVSDYICDAIPPQVNILRMANPILMQWYHFVLKKNNENVVCCAYSHRLLAA